MTIYPSQPRRGPGFVLAWAAAGVLMLLALAVLVQFALLLAGEQRLASAARAALREAALPHATTESVQQAAQRHLRGCRALATAAQTTTRLNGRVQFPGTCWQLAPGDQLSVTVGCLATSVVPDWLQCVGLPLGDFALHATARRTNRG